MASDWQTVELGEVASVKSGYAFKSTDWTKSGIPVVKIANVKDGRLEMEGCSYVDKSTATRSGEFQLTVGDILIAMTGYIGEVARVKEDDLPCVLNQRVGKFSVKDSHRLDTNFLYAFLSWAETRNTIESLGYGSAQPNVSPGLIHKIEMPLPPLPEQKRIAHILGTLDDKIELNRKMNATLEAMARALFKSWFVDFDPVRAKMEGRQPEGMDAETAALFPNSFEESELGLVPKGWDPVTLANHISIVKGRSYKSSELTDSKTALVTLKSFQRGGGYRLDGLKAFTGEYKPSQRVMPGDLLVAYTDVTQAADVIGKPAIVIRDMKFETLVASLDVGIVRPMTDKVSIPFLYFLFSTEQFQAHTYAHSTGTTVLHLSSSAIPSFKYCVPTNQVAKEFVKLTEPMLKLIDQNEQQSRTLATLRDTLIPKLLIGNLPPTAGQTLK